MLRPSLRVCVVVVAAATALSGVAAAAPPASGVNRPNILLILADDLGYSDIGAFGGEIATPSLDALAREGLRMTSFYAGAACSPTRAMLLSGVDNHLAGIGNMAELAVPEHQGQPGYEGYLNERVVPFPALLRQAGYRTYMAGKWHLGLTEERSPKARGFDRSFALLRSADDHVPQPWNTRIDDKDPWYREDGKLATVPADFYSSHFYADKMLSYLKDGQADGKPFFAYLSFTAPHWPLQAPPEVIAKYEHRYEKGYEALRTERAARQKSLGIVPKDLAAAPALATFPTWEGLKPAQRKQEARRMAVYAAMVDVMDQNIGKVIRYLKATGQYDNTVIVVLSDNGPEGADVPRRPPAIVSDNRNNQIANLGKGSSFAAYGPNWAQVGATPFRVFKAYSYEGATRVPAIVRYPGHLGRGQISGAPAHVVDIAPTVLELAGIAYPDRFEGREAPPLQGQSLVALFKGGTAAARPVFEQGWELSGQKAYRRGDWKAVYSVPPYGTGDWQLFDLATDPAEQHDLADKHPDKLAELKAAYAAYSRRNGVVEVPRLAERIGERYTSRFYFDALGLID